MENSERAMFAKAMDRLFSVYGGEITSNMRDAWWGALCSYEFDIILAGMNRHATDPDGGRFRPTPAHIINNIEHAMADHKRRLLQLREVNWPQIHAIEDELYRAEHDANMGKVERRWADSVIARCKRQLREINATIQAQAAIMRVDRIGETSSDENQGHAPRALRLARE